jgi:hypothetical protein
VGPVAGALSNCTPLLLLVFARAFKSFAPVTMARLDPGGRIDRMHRVGIATNDLPATTDPPTTRHVLTGKSMTVRARMSGFSWSEIPVLS